MGLSVNILNLAGLQPENLICLSQDGGKWSAYLKHVWLHLFKAICNFFKIYIYLCICEPKTLAMPAKRGRGTYIKRQPKAWDYILNCLFKPLFYFSHALHLHTCKIQQDRAHVKMNRLEQKCMKEKSHLCLNPQNQSSDYDLHWYGLNPSPSVSQITANLRFTVGGAGRDHSFTPAQASQQGS